MHGGKKTAAAEKGVVRVDERRCQSLNVLLDDASVCVRGQEGGREKGQKEKKTLGVVATAAWKKKKKTTTTRTSFSIDRALGQVPQKDMKFPTSVGPTS